MTGSVISLGIQYAAAGAVIGVAQPFVRSLVGGFVGSSPIANAGITFGTAWGLSKLTGVFNATKRYENAFLIAGATIASAQLISTYVLPYLRLGGGSANPTGTMSGPYWSRGRRMRGIAAVPSTQPPGLAAAPPPPPASMHGIAAYPTPGSFRMR